MIIILGTQKVCAIWRSTRMYIFPMYILSRCHIIQSWWHKSDQTSKLDTCALPSVSKSAATLSVRAFTDRVDSADLNVHLQLTLGLGRSCLSFPLLFPLGYIMETYQKGRGIVISQQSIVVSSQCSKVLPHSLILHNNAQSANTPRLCHHGSIVT